MKNLPDDMFSTPELDELESQRFIHTLKQFSIDEMRNENILPLLQSILTTIIRDIYNNGSQIIKHTRSVKNGFDIDVCQLILDKISNVNIQIHSNDTASLRRYIRDILLTIIVVLNVHNTVINPVRVNNSIQQLITLNKSTLLPSNLDVDNPDNLRRKREIIRSTILNILTVVEIHSGIIKGFDDI